VRVSLHRLPLCGASEGKLPVLSRLRTLRVGEVREWPAWVHFGPQVCAGRLVAVKRGRQATRAAQRRLRRKARRKQVTLSPAALGAAAYVFVWTSVPAEVLTAKEIMELCRPRWQIELAFKRLKSLMGLGHLPKWSDASCRAWIHGKLFIALLAERLLAAAEAVSPWGYRLVTRPQPLA
jgi:hypothetical protein